MTTGNVTVSPQSGIWKFVIISVFSILLFCPLESAAATRDVATYKSWSVTVFDAFNGPACRVSTSFNFGKSDKRKYNLPFIKYTYHSQPQFTFTSDDEIETKTAYLIVSGKKMKLIFRGNRAISRNGTDRWISNNFKKVSSNSDPNKRAIQIQYGNLVANVRVDAFSQAFDRMMSECRNL